MSASDTPIFSRLQRPPAYKVVADALQKAVLEKTLKPAPHTHPTGTKSAKINDPTATGTTAPA